jgi:hypothetical protein
MDTSVGVEDALRAHLLHCGFADPDDNTVPIFTGNDPHFAWTSIDKMVAALTARFEIRDRQAPPPADEIEWAYHWPEHGVFGSVCQTEADARFMTTQDPPAQVVYRRKAGPWIEAA